MKVLIFETQYSSKYNKKWLHLLWLETVNIQNILRLPILH